jgi:Arc/MetJ-type ribon-helix-helix transcriptional regulator
VRISTEEKAALDKLRVDRGNDENISDLVREALAMLRDRHEGKVNTALEKKLLDLATLLQREPGQVKNACLEGIFDLIENKARTPLIVMESQLYSSYSKS